tara:strand:+ start:401 stop:580 length:180 start_codon:yes stop_codon:yes gene_type:complete
MSRVKSSSLLKNTLLYLACSLAMCAGADNDMIKTDFFLEQERILRSSSETADALNPPPL